MTLIELNKNIWDAERVFDLNKKKTDIAIVTKSRNKAQIIN